MLVTMKGRIYWVGTRRYIPGIREHNQCPVPTQMMQTQYSIDKALKGRWPSLKQQVFYSMLFPLLFLHNQATFPFSQRIVTNISQSFMQVFSNNTHLVVALLTGNLLLVHQHQNVQNVSTNCFCGDLCVQLIQ